MKSFNDKKGKLNFIYLIFTNGKKKTVKPDSIRISNLTNTFNNAPDNFDGLFACSFKGGIALIPSEIARQIKNGILWNDNGFSPKVLEKVLKRTKKYFDFNLVKKPLQRISSGAKSVHVFLVLLKHMIGLNIKMHR